MMATANLAQPLLHCPIGDPRLFRCQCLTGEADGSSCRGPAAEPVLFIATSLGIQRLHNTLYDTVGKSLGSHGNHGYHGNQSTTLWVSH